jgi:hypothetical protein
MATKFVTNLDLNQNQIINATFEVLATDPSSGNFEGRLIYNSTTDTIKVFANSLWRSLPHTIVSGGGAGIAEALEVSESNGTITLTLKVADADSAGLLSATFFGLLNGATDAATASTLAKRDSNSQIKVATTPTDNNHATSKSYVDGAISSATVSTEAVQDIVGAQIATNGSHSGITATYQDADGDGAIDLALDSTYTPTFAGLTINGASITFEGATANDFETTVTVTDPTADRTITVPDATGTVALLGTIALGTDTTGNYVSDVTGGTGVTVTHTPGEGSNPTIAIGQAVASTDSPTFAGLTINGGTVTFEGATADDYETTLSITDPTADRTITIPNASGTVALTADKLSVFAATSSSELAGVISDETGTGALVFGTSPAITTSLTTPSTTFALVNTDATTINFGGAADINMSATGKTVTIAGNLTVNGTTTTISSTTITVDDKNLELGSVASPDNTTADGGGLTLKGATDKTFNWVLSTESWTSSEHLNLLTGKVFKINGTEVLSGSTLGSGVTGSSLTSVGTITTGVWNGTDIAVVDGGTGASDAAGAKTNLGFMTRYATSVGDAAATSFTVTHSLNTRDVIVQVREVAAPYAVVIADVATTTADTVTVAFATAPSSNQYRVTVIG